MSKNINHKKICNINDIFKFKYFNKLILIYLLLFNIKFTIAVATKCPLRKRRTVLSKHEAFIYFHVQKTPVHSWFFAAFPDGQSLIYCLVFSRRSFVFSSNVCLPLHCLFSFDLHLLITPLLLSNVSKDDQSFAHGLIEEIVPCFLENRAYLYMQICWVSVFKWPSQS